MSTTTRSLAGALAAAAGATAVTAIAALAPSAAHADTHVPAPYSPTYRVSVEAEKVALRAVVTPSTGPVWRMSALLHTTKGDYQVTVVRNGVVAKFAVSDGRRSRTCRGARTTQRAATVTVTMPASCLHDPVFTRPQGPVVLTQH